MKINKRQVGATRTDRQTDKVTPWAPVGAKKRTVENKWIWLLRHEHQITLYMKRCRMKMYIYRIKSCCLDISIKLSISTIRIEILISYLCQQHSLRISSSSSSVCSLCYTNSKHSNCFRKIVLCRIKSFIKKWRCSASEQYTFSLKTAFSLNYHNP